MAPSEVWHDLLAEGVSCRPDRAIDAPAGCQSASAAAAAADLGERQATAVAANVLDRSFEAAAPNRKWIADLTYVWTAEGWLYVAAVVDLSLAGWLAGR
jgi:putative transposase